VLVDYAQWADLDSLRWLVYLVRRLEGVPLALVLATRCSEPGPARELPDELAAIPGVGVLYPGDLSEEAVAALAAEVLAGEPNQAFVAGCHRTAGGNPFLIREPLGELGRCAIAPSRENAGWRTG
jgi:predicted ATPase